MPPQVTKDGELLLISGQGKLQTAGVLGAEVYEDTWRQKKQPPQLKEKHMKTKTNLYLLAVTSAALSLCITAGVAQPAGPADLKNRAIAASPRAIEVFPWLARSGGEPICCTEAVTKSNSALADVKKNRALASSPRMREVFPELARPAVLSSKSTVATRKGIDPLTEATRNHAFASSPRALETFPSLARRDYVRSTECSCE